MLKGRYQENDSLEKEKRGKMQNTKRQEVRKDRLEKKFALFAWTGSEGLLSQMR